MTPRWKAEPWYWVALNLPATAETVVLVLDADAKTKSVRGSLVAPSTAHQVRRLWKEHWKSEARPL